MEDSIKILISGKDKKLLKKRIKKLGYATVSEFLREQIRKVLE